MSAINRLLSRIRFKAPPDEPGVNIMWLWMKGFMIASNNRQPDKCLLPKSDEQAREEVVAGVNVDLGRMFKV
jgi:hypothetical protein